MSRVLRCLGLSNGQEMPGNCLHYKCLQSTRTDRPERHSGRLWAPRTIVYTTAFQGCNIQRQWWSSCQCKFFGCFVGTHCRVSVSIQQFSQFWQRLQYKTLKTTQCHKIAFSENIHVHVVLLLLLLLLKDLYSALGRIKKRIGALRWRWTVLNGVSRCKQFKFKSTYKARKTVSRSSVNRQWSSSTQ